MYAAIHKKLLIGITGASGSLYGKSLLSALETIRGQFEEMGLVYSENGTKVWEHELGAAPQPASCFQLYSNGDLFSPPASGSAGYSLMIICPCSMGTLGRIAGGISSDLITRAADVMLKERRRLILVIREMPYSLIHIRNMETITLAGGIICPASPAFYSHPDSKEEIVNTVIEKVLSLAGVDLPHYQWGSKK